MEVVLGIPNVAGWTSREAYGYGEPALPVSLYSPHVKGSSVGFFPEPTGLHIHTDLERGLR